MGFPSFFNLIFLDESTYGESIEQWQLSDILYTHVAGLSLMSTDNVVTYCLDSEILMSNE